MILFTGEGSTSVHAGIPHPPSRPPQQSSPKDQAPPLGPGTPPGPGTSPRSSRAYWEIRSTSGRYASYWNAILYFPNFALTDLRGSGCNFMQFFGKFGKIVRWHSRRVGARTSGKYWIRHCSVCKRCMWPPLNEGYPRTENLGSAHVEGEGVLKYYFMTRMHSCRMRTAHSLIDRIS